MKTENLNNCSYTEYGLLANLKAKLSCQFDSIPAFWVSKTTDSLTILNHTCLPCTKKKNKKQKHTKK